MPRDYNNPKRLRSTPEEIIRQRVWDILLGPDRNGKFSINQIILANRAFNTEMGQHGENEITEVAAQLTQ